MSRFYFGGSDSSGSDIDEDSLPYPKPLARSAFLTPEFDPTIFLSSLRNRHQTLEDLRTELRTRSLELNRELLNLVNDNYQDFLSLGGSLKGGDEKVEDVRVGLLGFKRDVEGLKFKVESRRVEVDGLMEEKRRIRKEIQLGKGLLEVDQRLEELEESLMVASIGDTLRESGEEEMSLSESEDDNEEETGNAISVSRLQRRVQQYVYIKRLMGKIGVNHPCILKQEQRVLKIRQTLLLDLSNVFKHRSITDEQDKARALKVMGLYRDMGELNEALQLLTKQRE